MYNVHEIKYPETIKYLQALVKCLEYYILRIYICTVCSYNAVRNGLGRHLAILFGIFSA